MIVQMLLLHCRWEGAGINQPFNLSASQHNDCVSGDGKSHCTSVDKTKCVSEAHRLGSTKCQLAQQGSVENENNLKGKKCTLWWKAFEKTGFSMWNEY